MVGSWKWEVGSWKWEVGSWKLEVGSGKWEVGSSLDRGSSVVVIGRMLYSIGLSLSGKLRI